MLKLLPLSLAETQSLSPRHPYYPRRIDKVMFVGGYPRLFDKKLPPEEWLSGYYQTYVERDVRELLKIGDLDTFARFIRLCAARVGSLINLSSLASDAGVTQPTAKAWLSVLKTSFICFSLQPYFKNFNKRLTKQSKLYFYDTGLLCYLLNIKSPDELNTHALRGAVFENWVLIELIKSRYNKGEEPGFYFWRDSHGSEVDVLWEEKSRLRLVEIKSSSTFHFEFLHGLDYLNKIGSQKEAGTLVYTGDKSFNAHGHKVCAWDEISSVLLKTSVLKSTT